MLAYLIPRQVYLLLSRRSLLSIEIKPIKLEMGEVFSRGEFEIAVTEKATGRGVPTYLDVYVNGRLEIKRLRTDRYGKAKLTLNFTETGTYIIDAYLTTPEVAKGFAPMGTLRVNVYLWSLDAVDAVGRTLNASVTIDEEVFTTPTKVLIPAVGRRLLTITYPERVGKRAFRSLTYNLVETTERSLTLEASTRNFTGLYKTKHKVSIVRYSIIDVGATDPPFGTYEIWEGEDFTIRAYPIEEGYKLFRFIIDEENYFSREYGDTITLKVIEDMKVKVQFIEDRKLEEVYVLTEPNWEAWLWYKWFRDPAKVSTLTWEEVEDMYLQYRAKWLETGDIHPKMLLWCKGEKVCTVYFKDPVKLKKAYQRSPIEEVGNILADWNKWVDP